MKWYTGGISDAIQYSHAQKAIFCVFVLGNDDVSQQLETALETEDVSSMLATDQFVCIRITADSQEHKQFSEIYSNVVSPSIYCITDKGVPVEIITKALSADELSQRFSGALYRHRNVVGLPVDMPGVRQASATPDAANAGTSKHVDSASLTAANDAVSAAEIAMNEPELSLEQRIERARKLALAKQQQKLEQEKEDAKRMEKERRVAGKGMAELKRWQDEEETRRALEERKKDKVQEQQLRQRLREQIAQDRAERNARSNVSYINDGAEPSQASGSVSSSSQPTYTSPANYSGKARLQFRMPDGSSQTHAFEKEDTLGHVRNFLIVNNHVAFKEFSLSIAYPRREFTSADYNLSLQQLSLIPSAALLVLPASGFGGARSPIGGNFTTNMWTFITALLGYVVYPLSLILNYFRAAIAPPPAPSASTSASSRRGNTLGGSRRDNPGGAPGSGSQGTSGTSKNSPQSGEPQAKDSNKNSPKTDNSRGSEGNIHRLRTSESDSDDEKATWNGNSTQQM